MEFLSSNLEELISETQREGAELRKIKIKSNPISGNGLYATSSITTGDILIEIPFSQCIGVDKILNSSSLSIIFQDNPFLLSYPDEILCIGLLHGLAHPETCPWSKHISVIPKEYNLTIFWNDDEIEYLLGSMIYHLTKMMIKQIQSDWDSIHSPIIQNYPELFSSNLTINDYKWAISTVYSRAIGFQRHEQYTRCIVPIIDMVNHHPSATNSFSETFSFNSAEDTILFVSTKDYEINDEVYASYGSYSNAKLLYTYGFILPYDASSSSSSSLSSTSSQPPRTLDMWSTLSQTTPNYAIKNEILKSNSLTAVQTYDFTGTIRSNGWISKALLATIRIIQANDEEMSDITKAFDGMITIRNERATYMSLLELLTRKSKQLNERLHEIKSSTAGMQSTRLETAIRILEEDLQTTVECIHRVDQWVVEIDSQSDNFHPHDSENPN